MKKSFFAVVLLSSSLLAYKEVVREIAQDIGRSNYEGAKAHLTRLHRFNLSQKEHKDILKDLKASAETVRKNQEDNVRIVNSWTDSLTTIGGSLVALYGLRVLLGGSEKERYGRYGRYNAMGEDVSGLSEKLFRIPFVGKALSLAMIPVGAYAAYNGYKCWYQNRCIGAAQKVEEYVEDALEEVKKG